MFGRRSRGFCDRLSQGTGRNGSAARGVTHTASGVRTVSPAARPIVQNPAEFDGILDDFIERYVLGAIPAPESVTHFHEALQNYVSGANLLFLLRYISKIARRGIYETNDGTRFRATDNAPAWWVHAALMQDYRIAPEAFANVVAAMPAHMFDVSATTAPTASAAVWHIAHIFDVNRLSLVHSRTSVSAADASRCTSTKPIPLPMSARRSRNASASLSVATVTAGRCPSRCGSLPPSCASRRALSVSTIV